MIWHNPTRPENLLNSVIDLVGLQQAPEESGAKFMCRLRGLYSRLKDISIAKIFTTLAIAGLDSDLYAGLIMRYRAGDPSVTEASIYDLADEVEAEDTRRPRAHKRMGWTTKKGLWHHDCYHNTNPRA